jgi:hypothetical protein
VSVCKALSLLITAQIVFYNSTNCYFKNIYYLCSKTLAHIKNVCIFANNNK